MKNTHSIKSAFLGLIAFTALLLAATHDAAAHCDTLDGPVIKDAHKAIETRNITPVLKWVKPHDEKTVTDAFKTLLSSKGANFEAAEQDFFATLVKIHRAGEGAPFTGLKPAGTVEPAVAEADKSLTSGTPEALVKLITGDIAAGIKKRYEHVAAAYKHKDKSVAQGREFVEAYIAYTHYVERLHQDATGRGAHDEHTEHTKDEGHNNHKNTSDHSKH